MKSGLTRKIIIPAAGFGTRIGSPPAKEMIIDPDGGKPLIEFSLQIAEQVQAQPVVITRSAKSSLLHYLSRNKSVETLCIESSREWPHSLLLAQALWGSHNLVILPDTRFLPLSAPLELFSLLEGENDVTFATFATSPLSTWGCVVRSKTGALISEKPKLPCEAGDAQAWGLFGFHRAIGLTLLTAMLESCFDHSWKEVPCTLGIVHLETFYDLTRDNSILPSRQ